MSQIRKVGTTLSLKSDLRSIEKSKKNFTLKPRRSRPSETALRLRSFPRGAPPLGENFFSKKIKINDFLYEIYHFYNLTWPLPPVVVMINLTAAPGCGGDWLQFDVHTNKFYIHTTSMSQIRKVGTTLSLKSDLRSIEKSKKNFTLKPRRSRPSETALRLRSFPRGGPPLGEIFFFKKNQN